MGILLVGKSTHNRIIAEWHEYADNAESLISAQHAEIQSLRNQIQRLTFYLEQNNIMLESLVGKDNKKSESVVITPLTFAPAPLDHKLAFDADGGFVYEKTKTKSATTENKETNKQSKNSHNSNGKNQQHNNGKNKAKTQPNGNQSKGKDYDYLNLKNTFAITPIVDQVGEVLDRYLNKTERHTLNNRHAESIRKGKTLLTVNQYADWLKQADFKDE